MEIFTEIALILAIAVGVSLVMRILRQPLIVGYIISGVIAGPYVLNIVTSVETIELFSKIGITILLFIVGLHLSPRVIKEVGTVSLATGVGQVLFTSLVGFGIALVLGIERIAALYTAIALTFSSTIIILKLLADKGDMNKLYGKISVGFLLVQDIIATVILIIVSSFTGDIQGNMTLFIGWTLVRGVVLIAGIMLVSSLILTRIYRYISTSQELLFLFSLTWGMGLACLFYVMNFSVEIGALVAGVTLSATPYANEIGSRMKPLRDFFIVLFFILLGSQMIISDIQALLLPAAILSAFVLIGNPIIVVILMNLLGHNRRTGFYAGLTVAQISEFSLILATLGFQVGHLSREVLSLITLVGLITIAGSTYLILYSDWIYPRINSLLGYLEFNKKTSKAGREVKDYTALLFGYDRVGETFVNAFQKLNQKYMVVDINPESIDRLNSGGIPSIYGDASDVEFLEELDIHNLKLVVSTIPDMGVNLLLVDKIKRQNPKTIVIVISHNPSEAKELYLRGATYVIMPHYLGARYGANLIKRLGTKRSEYEMERGKHLSQIYKMMG
ncbi:MAG: cation:proton antiporter [Patescibacteria group bacterium]